MVDSKILVALSDISVEQYKVTEIFRDTVRNILNYLTARPTKLIHYQAIQIRLIIHSDTSYLLDPKSISRVTGNFFLGDYDHDINKKVHNGAVLTIYAILKHIMAWEP